LRPRTPRNPSRGTPEQCRTFLEHIATDRLANLYHLILITGMRRGESVGLRWQNLDLDRASLSVNQQITDVNGRSMVSTPKTKRGDRVLYLDAETVVMLRRQQETQKLERTAWGRHGTRLGWCSPVRTAVRCGPSTSPGTSKRWPRTPAYPLSGCTTSATPMPAWRWTQVST